MQRTDDLLRQERCTVAQVGRAWCFAQRNRYITLLLTALSRDSISPKRLHISADSRAGTCASTAPIWSAVLLQL